MVYSVLKNSWTVLLAGVAYFSLGYFVYKYQLLYAMDHQQHSTGRAWSMICDRIFVGMIFFQLTTAGQLVLKQAGTRSLVMIPLLVATVWISIVFSRTYKPLMQFIALHSIKRGEGYRDEPPAAIFSPETASLLSSSEFAPERNVWADRDGVRLRYQRETRRRRQYNTADGQVVEEAVHLGQRFINPSLVAPLAVPWIEDVTVPRPSDSPRDSDVEA
nr:calcium permeable stress-gated cation channel 1 [Quercus suber]